MATIPGGEPPELLPAKCKCGEGEIQPENDWSSKSGCGVVLTHLSHSDGKAAVTDLGKWSVIWT